LILFYGLKRWIGAYEGNKKRVAWGLGDILIGIRAILI
jgi:hypothetical protein